jgi:hypothetical protein
VSSPLVYSNIFQVVSNEQTGDSHLVFCLLPPGVKPEVDEEGTTKLPSVAGVITSLVQLRAIYKALGEHLGKLDAGMAPEAPLTTWSPLGEPN